MPQRLSSMVLGIGLIAVVLVVLPYKVFELDRYFVPKELVLHVTALLLLALVLARADSFLWDSADSLMALFLVWTGLSAIFASDWWLAQRAVSVSISSAIVFWASRRLGERESYRPVLAGAAVASVLAAAVGLAQAYGVETEYFSLNRAPGGTFGNRNFVAHFCAIGLPALVWITVTARTSKGAFAGTLGVGLVAALLVLSRSRAAWLAAATMLVVLAATLVLSRRYWGGGRTRAGGRLAGTGLAVAAFVAAAVFVPNRLNWRSDSPYLDSAIRVMDYSSGSGRGRIAQYLNSGALALADPVLGAGPGNWPLKYPKFAPGNDPSIADDGRTANPWPSSDWVAFVSERGTVAAFALAAAFAVLFLGGLRRWSELGSPDAVLARIAGVATISATLVVSAFDAVLLLAAPALLAWSVLGATSGISRRGRVITPTRARRVALVGAATLLAAVGIARSAAQVVSINYVGMGGSRSGWIAGATWDPGSYRANVRAARLLADARRCRDARRYANRALALAPDAPEAKRVARRCR